MPLARLRRAGAARHVGCRKHWFTLPSLHRSSIWATYRPGQEVSKTPSVEYVAAAKAVQAWIAEHKRIAAQEAES